MAQALRMPVTSVGVYYRAIREAGLIRTGGRGRSASQVLALDIARLLLAIMTSELVRDAAENVRLIGAIRPRAGQPLPEGCGPVFEEAIAHAIQVLSLQAAWRPDDWLTGADEFTHGYSVSVSLPDYAGEVGLGQFSASYAATELPADRYREDGLGMAVDKSVGGAALHLLSRLLKVSK